MKLWTLAGENVSQGIMVSRQPFGHVSVGDKRVPLGKRDFPVAPERLMAADLYVTREKGTTLLVAEKDPTDPVALILTVEPQDDWVREWTLNKFEEVPCPRRGRPDGWHNCPICGVNYPAESYTDLFSPANIHPNRGMAQDWMEYQETDGIQTVMSGYVPSSRPDEWGYRSAAYRYYLLRMCPGESLRMHIYVQGEPQYDSERFLIWTGEELLFLEPWQLQGEYEQYKARPW